MDIRFFPNIGYLEHEFTNEELLPVRNEVEFIKNDFDAHKNNKHNGNLSGNIRKEYRLEQSVDVIQKLTYPLVLEFENHFNYFKSLRSMTSSLPIVMGTCWVNFQKKGEFNPTHIHDGILSFVIYINVPFYMSDELANSPGIESNNNVPGHFQFSYCNTLGNIQQEKIPVDKTYENTILLFPNNMNHTVYPFFTSDDYRISISGNYYLESRK